MQQGNRHPARSSYRKIIFIIMIYLFLTLTSKMSRNSSSSTKHILDLLKNNSDKLVVSDILTYFQHQQTYQGTWTKQPSPDGPLTQNQGRFELRVARLTYAAAKQTRCKVVASLYDGLYADGGVLSIAFNLDDSIFESHRTDSDQLRYQLAANHTLKGAYQRQLLLIQEAEGPLEMSDAWIGFRQKGESQVQVDMEWEGLGLQVEMEVLGEESRLVKTIIFAAVLFVVSFLPFSGILQIIRAMNDMFDNSRHYSLLTVVVTSMWDTVLCLVAFIYAFKDQESLMLFIIQAFFLCLLWTNLQPRLMISIYQQLLGQDVSLRNMVCKFNLIHYGSLLMIYPILIFTNINSLLILFMASILFPQIYLNASIGLRPQLSHVYYTKYIFPRFLLIFYLRACPYNVFSLAPDYPLALLSLTIIALQLLLLKIQTVYGPKTVIPAFLLEPVFDYKGDDDLNTEIEAGETQECAICLTDLMMDPPPGDDLESQLSFKIMMTPCNHRYHSRCLVTWMRVKMECPQCRSKLPPFQ